MLYGVEALGAAGHYEDVILQHVPVNWMVRVFTREFGDALPFVQKLAKRGQAHIGLNLIWRDDHNFITSYFPDIQREAMRFTTVIKNHPTTEWLISGATEHNLSEHDALDLSHKVLNVLPSACKYVNNPQEGKGGFVAGVINETHGSAAHAPNIIGDFGFSCDGSDCFDVDIHALKQRFAGAKYFMLWTCQFNGRMKADDPTPRDQRHAWPGAQLMDAVLYLANDPGHISLPDNWTIKPKSDAHQTPPEHRALKPVFIVPPSVKTLELRKGNKSFKASPPEPFVDGRVRFYFSDHYGYEMGSELDVIANEKKVGVCNPGFRSGGFR